MDIRDLVFRIRGFIPVPFVIAALVWADYNPWYMLLGTLLALEGEMLRINSVRYAGGATRTRNVGAPDLVSTGPYARMRNPLYAANMLIYSGFALASAAWFPYLPVIAFVFFAVQYSLIISLEESTLRGLFGREYEDYCTRVPRLFPKLIAPDAHKPPNFSLKVAVRQERSTLLGIGLSWILLILRLMYLPGA